MKDVPHCREYADLGAWIEAAHAEKLEYLYLTLDHVPIDGAPAVRFAERLKELIEGGAGGA